MKQLCIKLIQPPVSRSLILVLIGMALCGFSATETKADPLTFANVVALQNNGNTRVDLFSNAGTTLFGPQVSFLVDIAGTIPPGAPLQSLRIAFTEAGQTSVVQTFSIPAFDVVPPPFTLLFTLTAAGANMQGVAATLTVDIIGSTPDFIIPGGPRSGHQVDTFSYTFQVAEPVPEPTTILLISTGLVGLAAQRRRRRSKTARK
jgi:hypothetical protein